MTGIKTWRGARFFHDGGLDCGILGCIHGEPLTDVIRRTGAAIADPLKNPAGGTAWFHGTGFIPDEDDEYAHAGGTIQAEHGEHDTGWDDATHRYPHHWNTDLGAHFTSLHQVAQAFATGGPSAGDRVRQPSPGSRILHAGLHMGNPKHYASEFDMAKDAIDWAHANNLHFVEPHENHKAFVDGRYDHVSCEHGQDGDEHCDADGMGDSRFEHLHEAPHSVGDRVAISSIAKSGIKAHHGIREVEQYLRLHPERDDITQGFRAHLESQGHDGMTYGNSHEGPEGHTCAIAFPSTPIHHRRWQWMHPDEQHLNEPGQQQPRQRAEPVHPGQGTLDLTAARRTEFDPGHTDCKRCSGHGEVYSHSDFSTTPAKTHYMDCPSCGGSGQVEHATWEPTKVSPEQDESFNHRDPVNGPLSIAKALKPGTKIWRGEIRADSDVSAPSSVGIHWSTNPGQVILPRDVPEGHRAVMWEATLEHPDQAIPRSHPMWHGNLRSMDSEAEVRLRPGSQIHVDRAFHWTGGGDHQGFPWPQQPHASHHAWRAQDVGHFVDVHHRPSGTGSGGIDYSGVGIKHEGVQAPPAGLRFEHDDRETGGSKYPTLRHLRALDGDTVLGRVEYYPPRRSNGVVSIKNLYVDPDHRRRGVGSALMDEVQRRHPASTIDHGDRTDDGKSWWSGYTDGKSVTRGRTAGRSDDINALGTHSYDYTSPQWRGHEAALLAKRAEPEGCYYYPDHEHEHEDSNGDGPECPYAGQHTDWSHHYPHLGQELHRGLSEALHPDAHDESLPMHVRAHAVLNSIAAGHDGLGTHWTTNKDIAHQYALTPNYGDQERQSPVIIHAHTPERENIDTDPESLHDQQVFGYDQHDDNEVPIQRYAPVAVRGVSWLKSHDHPYRYHPDNWNHHIFDETQYHEAAKQAGIVPIKAYHASVIKDWPAREGWHHVGSQQAALDRAVDWDKDGKYGHDEEMHGPASRSHMYVHEVELHGRTYPHVIDDDTANYLANDYGDNDALPEHERRRWGMKTLHELPASQLKDEHDLPEAIRGYHVIPYYNDKEDKGSISYLVHHSAIKRTATHDLGLTSYAKQATVLDSWAPTERLFAPTKGGVDPRLFDTDRHMLPEVREAILACTDEFFSEHGYGDPDGWARVYLAGSQASEWYGNNDFDILVGINYPLFRQAHPDLADLSDTEIGARMNEQFRASFNDEQWRPAFDPEHEWHRTGYVNKDSWDIAQIKPYAAYNVTDDTWAVDPIDEPTGHHFNDTEMYYFEGVAEQARRALALPEPTRTQRCSQIWEFVHTDRSRAFGPHGTGAFDRGNALEKYLDQAPSSEPGVSLMAALAAVRYGKTAGLNGDLPEDLAWQVHFDTDWRSARAYAHPGGPEIGRLVWHPSTGEVAHVSVSPEHQRRGVASFLWEKAKQADPRLHHSDAKTSDGEAWSQRVGVRLYHGTDADLPEGTRLEGGHGHPASDKVWLTSDPDEAAQYGAHVYEVEAPEAEARPVPGRYTAPSATVIRRHAARISQIGPRPVYDSSLGYEVNRDRERTWHRGIREGLSLGHIKPEEAKAAGYHGTGHDQNSGGLAWEPLPHTLYHVTTHGPEVRAHGLKSRDELGQDFGKGLGGGESDTISFTDDPKIAEGIHESLHEFHGVLNGKKSIRDMYEEAKAGVGANEPYHSIIHSVEGYTGGENDHRLQSHLNGREHTRQFGSVEDMKAKGWEPMGEPTLVSKDGQAFHHDWSRPATEDERRQRAAFFYSTWASGREYAGGKMHPGYFQSDVKGFAAMDPKHFEIIKAHPRPGAQGYRVSALGEWRTATGKAVTVEGVPHKTAVSPSKNYYPAIGGGKYHQINPITGQALCRATVLCNRDEMPWIVDNNASRVHPMICRRCLGPNHPAVKKQANKAHYEDGKSKIYFFKGTPAADGEHRVFRGLHLGPVDEGTSLAPSAVLSRIRQVSDLAAPEHFRDRVADFGSHWTTDPKMAHQFAFDTTHGRLRGGRTNERTPSHGAILELHTTEQPNTSLSQYGESELNAPPLRKHVTRAFLHVHHYVPGLEAPSRSEDWQAPESWGKDSEIEKKVRTPRPVGYYRQDTSVHTYEIPLSDLHGEHLPKEGAKAASIEVAGIAIKAEDTGRVLLLQRSNDDQDDPARGTWEFPGGHIDEGESPFDGAKREWCEETGGQFPADGVIVGNWISGGMYQGFVVMVPSEADVDINLDHEDRHVLNPDDPDGDGIEVVAWWEVKHLKDNPAVRKEVRKGTDWDLLKKAKMPGSTTTETQQHAAAREAARKSPHHGEGPWYHGTNADLAPGDTLLPGDTVGKSHGKFSDGTRVWVSNDAVRAGAYGSRLYEVTPHSRPKSPYAYHDEHHTTGATVVREVPWEEARTLSQGRQAARTASASDDITSRPSDPFMDQYLAGTLRGHKYPDEIDYPLFHGSSQEFEPGDLIEPGHPGNFVRRMKHVYSAETPERATQYGTHVYQVQPTGPIGHRADARAAHGYWASEFPYRVVRRLEPGEVGPADRPGRTAGLDDEDYRGHHRAPDADFGAPMHDVNEMMPDFVKNPHWYGGGGRTGDRLFDQAHAESTHAIRSVEGKPERSLMIYRAVPHGVKHIHPGDWVTPSKSYAQAHARSESCPKCGGGMQIIKAKARAKDLYTEGDPNEWGYTGADTLEHWGQARISCPGTKKSMLTNDTEEEEHGTHESAHQGRHAGRGLGLPGGGRRGAAPGAGERGAGLARDAAQGPADPQGLNVTWHPRATKDLKALDRPVQKQILDTVGGIVSGDSAALAQSHPLTGPLKGWTATKASRGHRIIHRPNDAGGIHIGYVGLHEYDKAIQRLTSRESERLDRAIRAYHVSHDGSFDSIKADGVRPGSDGNIHVFTDLEHARNMRGGYGQHVWNVQVPAGTEYHRGPLHAHLVLHGDTTGGNLRAFGPVPDWMAEAPRRESTKIAQRLPLLRHFTRGKQEA